MKNYPGSTCWLFTQTLLIYNSILSRINALERSRTIKSLYFHAQFILSIRQFKWCTLKWLKIHAPDNRFRSIVGVLFQLIFQMARLPDLHRLYSLAWIQYNFLVPWKSVVKIIWNHKAPTVCINVPRKRAKTFSVMPLNEIHHLKCMSG